MAKIDPIKKEYRKYIKIFADISEDRKTFVEKTCMELAFMSVTLQELRDKVRAEGAVIEAVNGNGFSVKQENPAQKSYNVMIKNYNATVKMLTDMLPKEERETDPLMEFISRR